MKKVSIVGGGVLVVAGLLTPVVVFAWHSATRPIIESINAETRARTAADGQITNALRDIAEERIDLLTVMQYKPGSDERKREIARVRRKWKQAEPPEEQ